MRYASLFTGAGGIDLALEKCGWEPVFFCEVDRSCRKVLDHHWPSVPIIEDVRDVSLENPTIEELSLEQASEAVTLYQEGWSCGKLGARYGVSRQSMWDLLRRRIEIRPREKQGQANVFYRGTRASVKAQKIFEYAVRRGQIQRPDVCEECRQKPPPMKNGRTRIQAHHDDYNKPLEVRWLCQKCHHEWHKHHKEIPRKEVSPNPLS